MIHDRALDASSSNKYLNLKSVSSPGTTWLRGVALDYGSLLVGLVWTLHVLVGCGQSTAPVDASTIDSTPGSLGFLEVCDPVNDECAEPMLCFNYNARGPLCTFACTVAEDCPEPSTGCSMRGVCTPPQ